MKIIDTRDIESLVESDALSPSEIYWIYNGLDCCITQEVRHALLANLTPVTRATYEQTLRLQAPFLEMMLRGTLVDDAHRKELIADYLDTLSELEYKFNRLCAEGLGLDYPINWRSPTQVKALFYTIMGLKEIKARNANGNYEATVNREALEKLSINFFATPFCNFILAMRDIAKQVGFLMTPLDSDKRIRCNFNLAGTNTGRLSSSFSDFGTGTNLQNVDRNLKYMFVADSGKIMFNIDLEQADSRGVGALCWEMFYDAPREQITMLLQRAGILKAGQEWSGPIGPEFAGSYLDACESGDLHTTVCKMSWTALPWGDDITKWRAQADEIAYRTYSYRDMAKKLGHGTNYLGQPAAMALHTKVPARVLTSLLSPASPHGNNRPLSTCSPRDILHTYSVVAVTSLGGSMLRMLLTQLSPIVRKA